MILFAENNLQKHSVILNSIFNNIIEKIYNDKFSCISKNILDQSSEISTL